ncbi:MAG: F0F1 ATP synthase subunit A [Bacteroidales bacterium]|nr:F0F1 ATP synthase subunit A [Bacteroidales bacterium]MDD2280415.1 F0F1 ATP synthase subunit A [Bacteroidales bacterium]MDD4292426.1 F0F1 ATP synthase subunit A [Bacteroidales bacterium]MDD4491509.1 F0F1 ATP synthase subunit A [Bacteroidales bacterium]
MQKRIKIYFLLFIISVFNAGNLFAAEQFDVKSFIFSHIGDSYEWHITVIGEKEISVPLPVILIDKENGISIFVSSRLRKGASYKGYRISEKGEYANKIVYTSASGKERRPVDLSITKNSLALIINCSVLLILILSAASWYRKDKQSAPKGFVGAMEMFIMDINDNVIKNAIGKGYEKYAPYLLTVFFFILINNFMGLIPFFPGGANTTGNIAVTFVLALCTFAVISFSGTKEYWKEILWPNVPSWMKVPLPLMPAIEIFGVFTKPFALMIRLFANIMAGHTIILGLTSLVFVTVAMGAATNMGMTMLSVLLTAFMLFVELIVAYIQAYVFTLLSAVFIGLSRVQKHAIN